MKMPAEHGEHCPRTGLLSVFQHRPNLRGILQGVVVVKINRLMDEHKAGLGRLGEFLLQPLQLRSSQKAFVAGARASGLVAVEHDSQRRSGWKSVIAGGHADERNGLVRRVAVVHVMISQHVKLRA